MKQLLEKLKGSYEELSAGQKKVAKVFFESPNKIAFTPAFEIGKQVDVSESTVIRLAQKLGYTGYTELQEMIQRELTSKRVLSQHQEISNIGGDQSIFMRLMEADIANIMEMKGSLDESIFDQSIQSICKAEKIYITGNLMSQGLAQFFAHWMNMVLSNTEMLIPSDSQYYNHMSRIDEDTVVVSLILPRYYKSTIDTVAYAKKMGATVIGITDSELSPVAKYADYLLPVPINSNIKIDSYTAVMSLLTSMMRSVSLNNPERVEANLKRVEAVYHQNEIFFRG